MEFNNIKSVRLQAVKIQIILEILTQLMQHLDLAISLIIAYQLMQLLDLIISLTTTYGLMQHLDLVTSLLIIHQSMITKIWKKKEGNISN